MFILITTFECLLTGSFSPGQAIKWPPIRRQSYILNTRESALSSKIASSGMFPDPSVWGRPTATLVRYHSMLVSSRLFSPSDYCFISFVPVQCLSPLTSVLDEKQRDPLCLVSCGLLSKGARPRNVSSIHSCGRSERVTMALSLHTLTT